MAAGGGWSTARSWAQTVPFVIVMILAAAYGFGIGMAVAIWLMGRDPCSDRGLPPVSMK